MRYLSISLLLFIVIYSFWFSPRPIYAQSVQSALYEPRLLLLTLFIPIAGLICIFLNNQQKTLSAFFKDLTNNFSLIKLLILVYIFWIVICASFSHYPWIAWFGQAGSQFGGLGILLSIFIGLIYLYTEFDIDVTKKILASITFTMAALTLIEAMGFRPLEHWIHSPRMVYPAATVGLRQHLAGWFSIFALLPVLFYRDKKEDTFFWVWSISAFIGIALCTNSATTLGIIVSLLIYLISNFINKKIDLTKRTLILIFLFTSCIFTLPKLVDPIANFIGNSPQFKDYSSTATLRTRLILWESALSAAEKRPILGYGDETFPFEMENALPKTQLDKLYKLELSLPKDTRIIKENFNSYYIKPEDNKKTFFSITYFYPHGLIFNEIFSRGFIGLILLIAIIILLAKKLSSFGAEGLVFALPYIVYVSFTFYVVTVTPMYFIVLGIVFSILRNSRKYL